LALRGSDHDGTLLTEALRGEGATLLDASRRRFANELAPRDQLTAAILDRMDRDQTDHVALDLRSIDPARFPNMFAACRTAGLDPEREPVPVALAAHYLIGGVVCGFRGRTALPGLYAVGECACTGVHGANCLASNSLSECFVFGARAAEAATAEPRVRHRGRAPKWRFTPPAAHTREAMWRLAGPRRRAAEL
jgi:L-aspartate oxidase